MTGPGQMIPRVIVHDSLQELERAAAALIVRTGGDCIRERGTFLLVLSGGETPRGVYQTLGTTASQDRELWSRTHVLFGDERIVPPEDPRSTYGMVRSELLDRTPEAQVHRVRSELDPASAAEVYAAEIASLLAGQTDRPDLALLGLGEDGHTASLFPAHSAPPGWAGSIAAVPGPLAWRVTMTPALLNTSRQVVFLVSGGRKAAIVRTLLDLTGPTSEVPASLIRPRDGSVIWMLDRAAAAALTPEERGFR